MYNGINPKDLTLDLAVFDFDVTAYKVGFACERRSIEVEHNENGWKGYFSNRTEFWGGKKNTIEGYLGEVNLKKEAAGQEPATKDHFTIKDVQESEPEAYVLHTAKQMITKMVDHLGCADYMGYFGASDSFRVDMSTIWKYKGNREGALSPLMKHQILEYFRKYHKAIPVSGLEADDWCNIKAIAVPNSVVVTNDKDALGCPVLVYNPDKPELGVVNCDSFGMVHMNNSNACRGYGRLFKYSQIIGYDQVDNYKVNSATKKRWGEKATYDALKDCKNDKEAWEVMWGVFNKLYPEPEEVIGWRGEPIMVDALYMFQEQWNMAHMWRNENDNVRVEDILKRYKMI